MGLMAVTAWDPMATLRGLVGAGVAPRPVEKSASGLETPRLNDARDSSDSPSGNPQDADSSGSSSSPPHDQTLRSNRLTSSRSTLASAEELIAAIDNTSRSSLGVDDLASILREMQVRAAVPLNTASQGSASQDATPQAQRSSAP
jgi:hypothetical protein